MFPRSHAAVLLALVSYAMPVYAADKARARQVINEAIQIEQSRAQELARVAEQDSKIAHDLLEHVKYREEAAKAMDAKAADFRSAANVVDGDDKNALLSFANEFTVFAKHDREFATQRRQAADILERQAADARHGVEDHRAHIEKLKARLAKLN